MSEYWSLSSDGHWKVKSVTSSTRAGKAILRLELETSDLPELGYCLAALNRVQAAQIGTAKPKKVMLALPAPENAR